MNLTRIDFWTALLALLFSSAVLAGCNADRFNDSGCTADQQCRGDRICESGRCIHPEQLTSEPDAGGDQDADDDDDVDEVVIAVEDLVGTWDMVVNGTVQESGQPVDTLDDERTPVRIQEATQTDIAVFIGEEGGSCGLGANLTSDGFVFVREGCELEVGPDQRVVYEDVSGTSRLDDDGTLRFDLQMSASFRAPNQPAMEMELDVDFEGERVDDTPSF